VVRSYKTEKAGMTKQRIAILFMLTFCSGVSVIWGFLLERSARDVIVDFKLAYNGALCLVQHHDPYDTNQLMSVYLAEGGTRPSNPVDESRVRRVVALQVYLPTAFFCVAPFALMSWGSAYFLWTGITVASITIAAFLMWTLGEAHAPSTTFYLICLFLINCGILFAGGNPAGITIGLCIIAVWCFTQDKLVPVGVLFLALSLAIKPHDSGFVWLYFLLAGGVNRKRALQTLALTVVLGLPSILWVSQISPHWIQEMNANLSEIASPGSTNDPGPGSVANANANPGMVIDLQTVVSLFRNDPQFYNPTAYLICAPILIVWIIVTLRSGFSPSKAWLALAAIAALSLLPVYHRPHDAKILLLTIPACAMLWAEGGRIGWTALGLNTAGLLVTADAPLAMIGIFTRGLHLSNMGLWDKLITVVLTRPVPLVLLALSIFYVWVYAQRSTKTPSASAQPG
jgi:hypothetical protein